MYFLHGYALLMEKKKTKAKNPLNHLHSLSMGKGPSVLAAPAWLRKESNFSTVL